MSEIQLADRFSLPLNLSQERTAIFGMTDSGKTHTAVVMVEQVVRNGVVPAIIDPLGVWWGLQLNRQGDGPGLGLPIVGTEPEHRDYPLTPEMGALLGRWVKTPGSPGLIIEMARFNDTERRVFMREFGKALLGTRMPVFLVLDEADMFAPQNPDKGDTQMLSTMNHLSRRGRTLGVGMLSITQRPAVLNKNVSTQCTTIITHRLVSPQDSKALEDWIRSAVDLGDRQAFLKDVRKLQRGECFVLRSNAEPALVRIQVNDRATYNSSGTPDLSRTKKPLFAPSLANVIAGMESFVEKNRESDIAWLQQRVKDLERTRRESSPSVPPPPPRIEKVDRVSRQQVGATLGKALQLQTALEAHVEGLRDMLRRFEEESSEPAAVSAAPAEIVLEATPAPLIPASLQDLPKMQQQILQVLAKWAERNIAEVRQKDVAHEAGSSITSSSFKEHTRLLRLADLIAFKGDGPMALTAQGRACFPTPPPPATLHEFQERWLRKCNRAQQRMLRFIMDRHPRTIDFLELANLVDNSPTSSTYKENLRELRKFGLISFSGEGPIGATDGLYPPGLM